MMNEKLTKFLHALRGARRTRHVNTQQAYWSACAALAKGAEPAGKASALAEAMEQLNRTEQDLARDAKMLEELARAETIAAGKVEARGRLKSASVERATSEQKVQEMVQEGQRVAALAATAQAKARAEVQAIEAAERRAAELRAHLEKRGSPAHAGEAEGRERKSRIEQVEGELRTLSTSLQQAAKAAAGMSATINGEDENPGANSRASRLRSQVDEMTKQRDRLQARLDALKSGSPLDGDGDDEEDLDELLPPQAEVSHD